MAMNYGNLKKEGEAAKANQGWKPLTEDTFPCAYVSGEKSQTAGRNGKTKKDQFVNTWKIHRKLDEYMHKKILKLRTILEIDFHVDRFLTDMIDLGVDLDKITCEKDWVDVFEDLEEHRVRANIKVYYQEENKNEDGTIVEKAFPEFRIQDVIKGLPAESDWAIEGGWVPEDSADTPAPAAVVEAPVEEEKPAPAPAPVKEEPKPEPVAEPEPVVEEPVAEAPAAEATEAAPAETTSDDDWD